MEAEGSEQDAFFNAADYRIDGNQFMNFLGSSFLGGFTDTIRLSQLAAIPFKGCWKVCGARIDFVPVYHIKIKHLQEIAGAVFVSAVANPATAVYWDF